MPKKGKSIANLMDAKAMPHVRQMISAAPCKSTTPFMPRGSIRSHTDSHTSSAGGLGTSWHW